MKTKNKPGFGRLSGEVCWPHGQKTKNGPAQRDSKISILKTGPYRPLAVRLVPLCGDPYRPLNFKTTPAQQDSGNSKLGMGLIGPMGPIGLMGQKPVIENGPAQRDSGISILGVGVLRILRSLGVLGWKTENGTSPAQRDSGNSILGMGLMRPMGPIGLMGQNPVMENRPAQADSGISILGMEKHCHTEGAENTKNGIFIMRIKNIGHCFRGKLENESMSKIKNSSAQRYSKMSNLKIETENSLPQRHSKMSNGRLSWLLCRPHGQKEISTMQVKNTHGLFMWRKQEIAGYGGSLKVA